MRLKILESCLYSPVVGLWKIIAILLVVDGLLLGFRGMGVLESFALERTELYGIMVILMIIWNADVFSDRRISRIIFGKCFRIRIGKNSVRIGGLWSRHAFSRSKPLMFGLQDYDKPEDTVYVRSRVFCVVVDDSRRVRLQGVYGRNISEDLVENANMMLQLQCESREGELDLDPTRLPRVLH